MSKFKPLKFFRDSIQEEIQSWPEAAQKDLGHQMRDIQHGEMPASAKWLPDIGEGVIQCKTDGYRTIVTVAIDDEVWCVHAFKKDSGRGKKTRHHEMDLAKQRVDELLRDKSPRH